MRGGAEAPTSAPPQARRQGAAPCRRARRRARTSWSARTTCDRTARSCWRSAFSTRPRPPRGPGKSGRGRRPARRRESSRSAALVVRVRGRAIASRHLRLRRATLPPHLRMAPPRLPWTRRPGRRLKPRRPRRRLRRTSCAPTGRASCCAGTRPRPWCAPSRRSSLPAQRGGAQALPLPPPGPPRPPLADLRAAVVRATAGDRVRCRPPLDGVLDGLAAARSWGASLRGGGCRGSRRRRVECRVQE